MTFKSFQDQSLLVARRELAIKKAGLSRFKAQQTEAADQLAVAEAR